MNYYDKLFAFEAGLRSFATEFCANINNDFREILTIGQLNKSCYFVSKESLFLEEFKKIYDQKNSGKSISQLKEMLIIDLTDVCRTRTVGRGNLDINRFAQPAILGIKQIKFIHAVAKFLEKRIWIDINKNSIVKPTGKMFQKSWEDWDLSTLNEDEKNQLMNNSLELSQMDFLGNFVHKKLGPISHKILSSPKYVETMISENKSFCNQTKINLCLLFSGKRISSLPSEIYNFSKLKFLQISHSKICKLPQEIFDFKSLKTLALTCSSLRNFPDNITKLVNLTSLNLSENNISFIPDEIKISTKLKILSINHNLLRSFPKAIFSLVNLTSINMSSNKIRSVPDGISSLTSLKKIILNSNLITSVSKCITELTSLTSLNIKANPLRSESLPYGYKFKLLISVGNLEKNEFVNDNNSEESSDVDNKNEEKFSEKPFEIIPNTQQEQHQALQPNQHLAIPYQAYQQQPFNQLQANFQLLPFGLYQPQPYNFPQLNMPIAINPVGGFYQLQMQYNLIPMNFLPQSELIQFNPNAQFNQFQMNIPFQPLGFQQHQQLNFQQLPMQGLPNLIIPQTLLQIPPQPIAEQINNVQETNKRPNSNDDDDNRASKKSKKG